MNTTELLTTVGEIVIDVGTQNVYQLVSRDRILKIVYYCLGVLGFFSNSFVVLVMVKFRSSMLRQVPNIYILNQSLIDAAASLILIFSYIYEDDGRELKGSSDELYCRVWLNRTPLWGIMDSSSLNLVAVSVERYLAIVKAIWHKLHLGRRAALFTLPCIWLSGLLIHGAFMVPSTRIVDGACWVAAVWPSPEAMVVGILYLNIIQIAVPLAVFVFCYSKIAIALRGKVGTQTTSVPPGKMTGEPSFKIQARKNVIKTLALVTVCYVVCWFPNQTYIFLFGIGVGHPYVDFTSTIYHLTVVLVFVNCTINPFVYILKYKQFQNCVRTLICKQSNVGTDFLPSANSTNNST